MKKLLYILLALSLVLSVIGPAAAFAEAEDDKCYIGVATFLTGSSQSWGTYVQRGMEIALEEINANGGILGKQVEARYFDGVDSLQATVNSVRLAIEDEDLLGLIFYSQTAYVVGSSPFLLEAGLPTITEGSGVTLLEEANPYVWMIRTMDNYVGVGMVNFALEELGVKNPAVWSTSLDNAVATRDIVVETLAQNGIEVPEDMIYTTTDEETNYAPIAAQIKASGADSLIIFSSGIPIANLARALQDADVDIPVVGPAGISNSVCVEIAGDAIEGWYCVADYIQSDEREIVQSFVERYQEKYGDEVVDTMSACTYDMVHVFKRACEIANTTTDHEAINQALGEIQDLECILGTVNSHDDNTFLESLFIGRMENGVPTYISTVKYR